MSHLTLPPLYCQSVVSDRAGDQRSTWAPFITPGDTPSQSFIEQTAADPAFSTTGGAQTTSIHKGNHRGGTDKAEATTTAPASSQTRTFSVKLSSVDHNTRDLMGHLHNNNNHNMNTIMTYYNIDASKDNSDNTKSPVNSCIDTISTCREATQHGHKNNSSSTLLSTMNNSSGARSLHKRPRRVQKAQRQSVSQAVLHCHRVGLPVPTLGSGPLVAMQEILSDEAEAERAKQRRRERAEQQKREAEARQRRRDRCFHSANSHKRINVPSEEEKNTVSVSSDDFRTSLDDARTTTDASDSKTHTSSNGHDVVDAVANSKHGTTSRDGSRAMSTASMGNNSNGDGANTTLVTNRFIHHFSEVSSLGSRSSNTKSTISRKIGNDGNVYDNYCNDNKCGDDLRDDDDGPAESVKERTERFLREMHTHLTRKHNRRSRAAVIIQTAWRAAIARAQHRARQQRLFAAVYERQSQAASVMGGYVRRWLCQRWAAQQREQRTRRQMQRVRYERAQWRREQAWRVVLRCWRNRCQREDEICALLRQFRSAPSEGTGTHISCDGGEGRTGMSNGRSNTHSNSTSEDEKASWPDHTNSATNYDSDSSRCSKSTDRHRCSVIDTVAARQHARALVRVVVRLQQRWRSDAPRRRARWAARQVIRMQVMAQRQAATVLQRFWRNRLRCQAMLRAAAVARMHRVLLQRKRAEAVGLIVRVLRAQAMLAEKQRCEADVSQRVASHNGKDEVGHCTRSDDDEATNETNDSGSAHDYAPGSATRMKTSASKEHSSPLCVTGERCTTPQRYMITLMALVRLQRWWRCQLAHRELVVRRAHRSCHTAARVSDEQRRWLAACRLTRLVHHWCQQRARTRAAAALGQLVCAALPVLQSAGRGYVAGRVRLCRLQHITHMHRAAMRERQSTAVRCVQSVLLTRIAQRQIVLRQHARLLGKLSLRKDALRLWDVEQAAGRVQRVWRRRVERRNELRAMQFVRCCVQRVQRWWRGVRARAVVARRRCQVQRLQDKREMAEEVMWEL